MTTTTTLEITPSFNQPYELRYKDSTGRTTGAPSPLDAFNETEAREELAEEYGYTSNEIEQLFNQK